MKEKKLRKAKLTKAMKRRLKETDTWDKIWNDFERGKLRTFAGYNRNGKLRRGKVITNPRQAWWVAITLSGKELGYKVHV